VCSGCQQVGYVEQVDVHTPAQTVREALWFSGRLRLGTEVSDEQVGVLRMCQSDAIRCTQCAHSEGSFEMQLCPCVP
jgi:hypothetical protein